MHRVSESELTECQRDAVRITPLFLLELVLVGERGEGGQQKERGTGGREGESEKSREGGLHTFNSFRDLLGSSKVIMVKSVPTWLRARKNTVVSAGVIQKFHAPNRVSIHSHCRLGEEEYMDAVCGQVTFSPAPVHLVT